MLIAESSCIENIKGSLKQDFHKFKEISEM